MSEPASSGAAGVAGWKLIGGMAGVAAIGAGLAALVVMCMQTPRSPKEWAVGMVSTVIGSVCGGAAVVMHFNLQHWAYEPIGLIALIGLIFACGLPAWAIVRWSFTWMERRKRKDIGEIVDEVRRQMRT